MINVIKTGNGGDSIVPSARKSIHNHHGPCCPFWHCEQMARRLGSKKERNPSQDDNLDATSSDMTTDEVDNVMSKYASTPSIDCRSNSYNLYKTSDESDSEESEEADSFQNRLLQCRNSVHKTLPYNTQIERRRIEENIIDATQRNKNRGSTVYWSLLVVVVVPIAIWYGNLIISQQQIKKNIYDKFSFYKDVKDVGNKYNINDDAILQVRAGIATIFERQDTGSFIFAYNSAKPNFNPDNFNNFVNDLALAAARYLRNETNTIHHVVVDSYNLHVQTDKELMNEYLADVDKTGVMLVKDLDQVPSSLAMAFHYYCDEYNPLVKRSAMFFTLNMATCAVSRNKYSHENVEKCLANKWNKLPQENIQPLLTRVVSVVIDVTSDF